MNAATPQWPGFVSVALDEGDPVSPAAAGCAPCHRPAAAHFRTRLALYGDHDLPSGMVSQHVGDRIRGLAEGVDLVDDHLDVAELEERCEGFQVLAVHD